MSSSAERNFDKFPYANPEDHAHPVMREAITKLLEHHSEVKQMKSQRQLKLSQTMSYYPTTRRIVLDDAPQSIEICDVEDVVKLLHERGELVKSGKATELQFT